MLIWANSLGKQNGVKDSWGAYLLVDVEMLCLFVRH